MPARQTGTRSRRHAPESAAAGNRRGYAYKNDPCGRVGPGGGVALSAEPSMDAARRCAQVKDSLERLVCYDRALAGTASSSSSVPVAPAPVVRAAPAAAPEVAPAPREFGDDTVKRTEKERASARGPTSLTAAVSELKEYRLNTFMLRLDNGQIWQQMDMDRLFEVKVHHPDREGASWAATAWPAPAMAMAAASGCASPAFAEGRSGHIRIRYRDTRPVASSPAKTA